MSKTKINGTETSLNVPPDTPLLWVIREELNLCGTKFGCGMGLCGACTVHVEGVATRACVTSFGAVEGKTVSTIESMGNHRAMKALQEAWYAGNVAQCGYCQSGQLMAAAALLATDPAPTDAAIDAAMAGNICRCGTYQRIRTAIHAAAAELAKK